MKHVRLYNLSQYEYIHEFVKYHLCFCSSCIDYDDALTNRYACIRTVYFGDH